MDDQQWTFITTETDPFGLRVTVTVELPCTHPREHLRDCAELTQMAATSCAKRVADSVAELAARAPF